MKSSKSDSKGINTTLFLSPFVNELLDNAASRSGRSKKQEATIRLIDFFLLNDEAEFKQSISDYSSSHVTVVLGSESNIELKNRLTVARKLHSKLTKTNFVQACLLAHLKRYQSISELGKRTLVSL